MNALGLPLVILGELLLIASLVVWVVQRMKKPSATAPIAYDATIPETTRATPYTAYPSTSPSPTSSGPVFPTYAPPQQGAPMQQGAAPTAGLDERTAKLERLNTLLAQNLITQQEYEALRAAL